jgi:hypothetical protein
VLFYAHNDRHNVELLGRQHALAIVRGLGNGGTQPGTTVPGGAQLCKEAELNAQECEAAQGMIAAGFEGDVDKFLRYAAQAGAVYACQQVGLGWASGFCASIGGKIYDWISGLFSGVGTITGAPRCNIWPRPAKAGGAPYYTFDRSNGKPATVAGLRKGEYIIKVNAAAKVHKGPGGGHSARWESAVPEQNYYYPMKDCAYILGSRVEMPWIYKIYQWDDGRPGLTADGKPNGWDPCNATGDRPRQIPDPNWFSWSKNAGKPTDNWNATGTAWALINMIETWKMRQLRCSGKTNYPSATSDVGLVYNHVNWGQFHREISGKPCEKWKKYGDRVREIMSPPNVQTKIAGNTFTTGRVNPGCRFLAFKDWDGTLVEMDDKRQLKITKPNGQVYYPGKPGRQVAMLPGMKMPVKKPGTTAPGDKATTKPFYKKGAFWAVLGIGVVGSATVGGAYYFAKR